MPTTIGSHSLATLTSPVNGTTPIDANTVRGNDNAIRTSYNAHDADPGIHVQSSSLASRPTAAVAGRKWITVDAGSYKLWYDDGTTWHEVASGNIDVFVIADENLVKGDVVKVTGYNTGTGAPRVAKVSSAADVAFGIITGTIANGGTGYLTNTGLIIDVNTNAFAIGDILYPNTSGGLTATKPASGNYQVVAYVLRSNTNNGVLYVEFSAPRIVERSDNTVSTIVLRDASGDFAAGTITATAINTTTLDLTNLEVTNIKAKDGTASATIADATGVMTIGSSVLTTTDINGGTIDGTTIGGASAAAGTFTTATATTGNITTVNATTVDTTNIEVTNVKAKDGTASIAVADSTGVMTINAAPILSALTASQAVFTDGSKALVSNAITGTGNVVMSASPTLTGTVSAASLTASGTVTAASLVGPVTGNASTATALQTARNINGVSFNGTADITVTAAAGTLSGNTLASGVTASSLTSVGTLTSLAVSGDLTVDGGTLNVDSANNRVGISRSGAFVGSERLHIGFDSAGAQAQAINFRDANASASGSVFEVFRKSDDTYLGLVRRSGTDDAIFVGGNSYLALGSGNTERLRIDASGNVGIGTASPAAQLHIANANGDAVTMLQLQTGWNSPSGNKSIVWTDATSPLGRISVSYDISSGSKMTFGSLFSGGYQTSDLLTLNASGNVGLGVTPSAWSTGRALELGAVGNSIWGNGAGNLRIFSNAYFNSGFKYASTGLALQYSQDSGEHAWFTAPSGTAGDAISFTQAMTLTANSQLGLGIAVPTSNGGTTAGLVHIHTPTAAAWSLTHYTNGTTGSGDSDGMFVGNIGADGYVFNYENGFIQFATNSAERARFTAGGYFKASNDGTYQGATSAYHEIITNANDAALAIANRHGSAPRGFAVQFLAASPNNTSDWFGIFTDSTTTRAVLYSNGDWQNVNGVYGTISDLKVKQDITDAGSSWDDVKAYRWRKYRRRSDVEQMGDKAPWHLGVIAQEIEQVSAGLVDTHADTEEYEEEVEVVRTRPVLDDAGEAVLDDDGEAVTEEYTETEIVKKRRETGEVTKSVKLSILHNKAVVALQEAMARIEAIEAQLATLTH
jgi:hypothetical protein